MSVITTDPAAHTLTNATIQQAIDQAAAQGGGEVRIQPGVYTLHDSIKLRSGVRLVGEPGAILRKDRQVESDIPDFLGYGHYEFTAAQPERFHTGMGVHLYDDNAGGFYTTVATITEKRGEIFIIDRMLNHDYLPHAHAKVTNLFPLIEGCDIQHASVSDLTIDGNADENARLNGCRGGGVFLIGCSNVRISNLDVHHYNGDAVSFQQCHDIAVTHCHIHHNTGAGLHPGSGSVRYLFEHNNVHDNGGWGLFYCLRTTHSICRHNTFQRNALDGISVGERDTHHLIEHNTIRDNGGAGVDFRPPIRTSGNATILRANTLANNALADCNDSADRAQENQPDAEIVIPAGLADVWLDGNTIEPAPGKRAFAIAPDTRRIYATGNTVAAGESPAPGDHVSTNPPDDFPAVGPEGLPPQGAQHLNIDSLTDAPTDLV